MVERGGLGVMGICTRIMILFFYLSSIVSMFSDPTSVPVDFRLTFTITGYALILLGLGLFFLTFIGDFIKYRKDRKS
ncbi:MAG: hypothetical protein ACFFE5_10830 [Candidatus Thorarchaeota archaeon]